MNNREIAEQLIHGKKKSYRAGKLKQATAIRVAAHRLGGVLTVQRVKQGFRLVKSTAKVWHRRQTTKKPAARRSKG